MTYSYDAGLNNQMVSNYQTPQPSAEAMENEDEESIFNEESTQQSPIDKAYNYDYSSNWVDAGYEVFQKNPSGFSVIPTEEYNKSHDVKDLNVTGDGVHLTSTVTDPEEAEQYLKDYGINLENMGYSKNSHYWTKGNETLFLAKGIGSEHGVRLVRLLDSEDDKYKTKTKDGTIPEFKSGQVYKLSDVQSKLLKYLPKETADAIVDENQKTDAETPKDIAKTAGKTLIPVVGPFLAGLDIKKYLEN